MQNLDPGTGDLGKCLKSGTGDLGKCLNPGTGDMGKKVEVIDLVFRIYVFNLLVVDTFITRR